MSVTKSLIIIVQGNHRVSLPVLLLLSLLLGRSIASYVRLSRSRPRCIALNSLHCCIAAIAAVTYLLMPRPARREKAHWRRRADLTARLIYGRGALPWHSRTPRHRSKRTHLCVTVHPYRDGSSAIAEC